MGRHDRRVKICQFLEQNPGWHTTGEITKNVGSTNQNISNQADSMTYGSNPKVEKQSNLGRGNQNQYRLKENED